MTDTRLLQTLALKVREDLLALYPVQWHRGRHKEYMFQVGVGGYRFFDEDFTGACGVASYMLTLLARRHKISLDLAGHAHHIWCQLPGKTVVDPTFSQYNESLLVYIGTGDKKAHSAPAGRYRARTGGFMEGLYSWDKAKVLVKRFPDIQNPFSKYHSPVIQKWLLSLEG